MFWCLVGNVAAYDTTLDNVGWGWTKDTVRIGSSPTTYTIGGNNVYLQVKQPGNVSFSLRVDAYGGMWCSGSCSGMLVTMNIYGLNYTNGVEVWTAYDGYSYFNINGFQNPISIQLNTTAYSNVGIYQIVSPTYAGNLVIYPELSYIGYNTADYSARTYSAGTTYTIPVINKYYLFQETNYVVAGGVSASN